MSLFLIHCCQEVTTLPSLPSSVIISKISYNLEPSLNNLLRRALMIEGYSILFTFLLPVSMQSINTSS